MATNNYFVVFKEDFCFSFNRKKSNKLNAISKLEIDLLLFDIF